MAVSHLLLDSQRIRIQNLSYEACAGENSGQSRRRNSYREINPQRILGNLLYIVLVCMLVCPPICSPRNSVVVLGCIKPKCSPAQRAALQW